MAEEEIKQEENDKTNWDRVYISAIGFMALLIAIFYIITSYYAI